MTVATAPLTVGDPKTVVSDAAVELLVSLAPVTMSVAEVEALRQGSVIQLGCSLAHAEVVLRIGANQVAAGRFVIVADGAAAVELTRGCK